MTFFRACARRFRSRTPGVPLLRFPESHLLGFRSFSCSRLRSLTRSLICDALRTLTPKQARRRSADRDRADPGIDDLPSQRVVGPSAFRVVAEQPSEAVLREATRGSRAVTFGAVNEGAEPAVDLEHLRICRLGPDQSVEVVAFALTEHRVAERQPQRRKDRLSGVRYFLIHRS